MASKIMIRWKLNELMAAQRKKNKDLALEMGMTESSISRMRQKDVMPRLAPEVLNGLCKYLNCQPGDLMTYVSDH